MGSSSGDDPYKRLNYRRLIAWPKRIKRESPFLEAEIRQAPEPSVVDLGCGTGEHARHFAGAGFRAVGIDRSPEQIETASDFDGEFGRFGPQFLCGEIAALEELTQERFGAAICLGNVLPHLEDEELAGVVAALAERLLPGGRLVVQMVNYERIIARGERHLPLNVRDDPEASGEIVFLRLMKRDGDRHVLFFPSTLELRPGEEPPLSVRSAKEVRLRTWRLVEIERAFAVGGFRVDGVYGDMRRAPYEADDSADLVVTAVFDGGPGEPKAGEPQ